MIGIRFFLRGMLTLLASLNSFFLSVSANLGIPVSLLYAIAAAGAVLLLIFLYSTVKSRREAARFEKIARANRTN